MSWSTYNDRKAALHDVLAIADRRRAESIATELFASVESANTAFSDEADLLLDIQMLWHQTLSGHLDRMLSAGAEDLEHLMINAWIQATKDLPGARALLDASRDWPEFAVALRREREFVARSSGVPWNHPHLLREGRRIIEMAKLHEPVAA